MANKTSNKDRMTANPFKAREAYKPRYEKKHDSLVDKLTFTISLSILMEALIELEDSIFREKRLMDLCNTPCIFYKA